MLSPRCENRPVARIAMQGQPLSPHCRRQRRLAFARSLQDHVFARTRSITSKTCRAATGLPRGESAGAALALSVILNRQAETSEETHGIAGARKRHQD